IFASKLTHQVYFSINEKEMGIKAEDVDFGGEGHETINVQFNGKEFFLIYNANYLLEILLHIDAENLVIKMNSINNPTIIKEEETEESDSTEDYLALIMPVSIKTNEE
ncbi:MAG: hypothetical protein KAR38_07895, partial [Calditrichia bacterium]|nr:hypothetical protein [Calditrichia bacterium]